ncbi:MAG: transposase [Chloroflexaceae bacterium]
MRSRAQLTTAVETVIRETMDRPQAARRRLVFLVIGVLVAGTIVLRHGATTPSHIGLGTVPAASHERRLRRILNDPKLRQAVPMDGRLVRRMLQRMSAGQHVWRILDASGHADVVRVLLAARWYRGRAIPLTWVLWRAQHPHAESSWTECHTLLAQVATILPAGVQVTVLDDRACGCPAFTDLVQAQGWDDLVRVPDQTRLRHADGRIQELRTLLSAAGTRWYGTGHACKQQGWRPVSVVAYRRAPCRAPLLLVSRYPLSWDVVRQDRLRRAIEALVRDGKRSGWPWVARPVRDPQHQAVLVLVLAIVTLLTRCLGEEVAQACRAQPPQTGQRRPWHARNSLVRLGRDRRWQRRWQQDERPIDGTRTQFDAPNWSIACWQAARP